MKMSVQTKAVPKGVAALLIVLIFTVKFLLFVPQVYFYNSTSQNPLPFSQVLFKLALGTYSWAALTPLILFVSRRWLIERPRLARHLLLHFCLSFLFAAAQTLIYHLALAVLMPGGFDASAKELPRLDGPLSFVFNGIVAYMSILAVHQAILHYRESSERAFRLQQAQLQLLKTQLQPHFLFNSLNTIASLIYRDQAEAERTVLNLSDMLRISLYEMGQQETTLREELEFVHRYVQIMSARFPGRFEVRTEIAPQTFDACVPTMTLQTLVENSILHGILPGGGGGLIEILARREGEMLQVVVSDDGRGIEQGVSAEANGGIGLANMRARLQYLYGSRQRFELSSRPGAGTTVTVDLPFRPASDWREQRPQEA